LGVSNYECIYWQYSEYHKKIKRDSRYTKRHEFSPVDVKTTPFITSFETPKKKVFNPMVFGTRHGDATRTWITDVNLKGLACKTTVDWVVVNEVSLYPMEGVYSMTVLSVEQRQLISKLISDIRTSAIYQFTTDGIPFIWVVVKEANFDTELEYSQYFVETVEEYPSLICDFMVYGEDEILHVDIPTEAKVIFSR